MARPAHGRSTFVPLAAMILACLLGRGVRVCAGIFAFIYPLALAPVADRDRGRHRATPTESAVDLVPRQRRDARGVLAFPLPLQVVWTAFVPLLFGVVRLIQGEFARTSGIAVALDVSFALILGGRAPHARLGVPLGRRERRRDAGARGRVVRAGGGGGCRGAGARRRRGPHARQRAGRAHRRRARAHAARAHARRRDGARGAHPPRQHRAGRRGGQRRAASMPRASPTTSNGPRANSASSCASSAIDRPAHARRCPGRVARALVLAATQARRERRCSTPAATGSRSPSTARRPARVRIEVRDTGAGLRPRARARTTGSASARRSSRASPRSAARSRSTPTGDGTTVRLEWREGAA